MRVLRLGKAYEDESGDIVACLPEFRREVGRKSKEDSECGEERG
jgi:hypothetical protein